MAALLTALLLPLLSFAGPYDWKVTKQWSPAYEKKFQEFVNTMGESGCRSLDACLTSSSSNPFYAARTPRNRKFLSDCADLPFALRMYFSWMEGLPFDYVNQVAQADPQDETNDDIRYTKFGNKPAGRRVIKAGAVYNAFQELTYMRNSVSTATYRMHYNEVSDFYPAGLNRNSIHPGTVVYDPSGHAAIVYKVEKDGRIKMMDAHPDNSITRITFDQKFTRSRPAHGAGFKSWRPELNYEPSASLPGFSTEQFNKTFSLNGERVSFYDYVRARMAGSLRFDPVVELKTMMSELCSNVHDREIAVSLALRNRINEKRHPSRLPENIYGTEGEWEEYSSPSRDARLKVAFVELRTETERFINMYRQGSSRIVYEPKQSRYSRSCGSDKTCYLVGSLLEAYEQAAMQPACVFQYEKSDGRIQRLSYTDMVDRLFRLSFDPYHCAELRWGANNPEELASCRDEAEKIDWYKAEQNLRNQTERTYDARMDADVNGARRLGQEKAPKVDLWQYLVEQLP
jgi:hypothetical protein